MLGNLLSILVETWDGPILSSTEKAMSAVLQRDLPTILEGDDETARVVALALRDEVLQILSW